MTHPTLRRALFCVLLALGVAYALSKRFRTIVLVAAGAGAAGVVVPALVESHRRRYMERGPQTDHVLPPGGEV
jgi:hypothetical protein